MTFVRGALIIEKDRRSVGKTTAMSYMVEEFTERGFRVLCVPEAATILISNGLTNQTCGSSFQFRKHLMSMQVELELSSEDEEVILPKELEQIRKVTDDDAYKNVSLAKKG